MLFAVTRLPKFLLNPMVCSSGLPRSSPLALLANGAMMSGRGGISGRTSVQRWRPNSRCHRPWIPSGEVSANNIRIGAKISHQFSVIADGRSSSRMKAIAPHKGPST